MRLETLDAARAPHHKEALRRLDAVGRDVDAVGAHQVQRLAVLRFLAFRIEVDPQFDGVGNVLTGRRVVDVPHDARAGEHQLAGIRPHELALLADGPFHEGAGVLEVAQVDCGGAVLRRQVRLGLDLL